MKNFDKAQEAYESRNPVEHHAVEVTDEDRYCALAASWIENGGDVTGARAFNIGEFCGWVVSEMSARGKLNRFRGEKLR